MTLRKFVSYAAIVLAAVFAALSYAILVIPNSFAPSGVNGICVIIQKVFGINIGYMSILINIPLALVVFFKVSKSLAIRSMVYIGVFSVGLIVVQKFDISFLVYHTDNGTSRILGPLIAGIIMGCVYTVLMRSGAYTGGTDFISVLVQSKNPQKSVFRISFIINSVVALLSYIVYGYNIEPVFLSILYSFASTTIADRAMRSGRSAMRFTIVTDHSQEIANEIILKLHHSATILDSEGAYSHKKVNTLICIVNNGQINLLCDILRKYPGTFSVMDPVSEVLGNFKKLDRNGHSHHEIFDAGNTQK